MGPAFVEIDLGRLVVLLRALHAKAGVGNGFEPDWSDVLSARLTLAERALAQSLQRFAGFDDDVLLVVQQSRVHVVQEFVGAHVAEVERSVGEFASAIAAAAGASLFDHAIGIGADAGRNLSEQPSILVGLIRSHSLILCFGGPSIPAGTDRRQIAARNVQGTV